MVQERSAMREKMMRMQSQEMGQMMQMHEQMMKGGGTMEGKGKP